jgi:hypothetical protein
MKLLNGNPYFDKADIAELKKNAVFYCLHPDDDYEFLYLVDEDERKTVIEGITALENTLGWEFANESAINLLSVTKCYDSLKVYSSNLMEYDEFKKISVHNITSYTLTKYENWLKSIGHAIFYDFFKNYDPSTPLKP